MKNIEDFVTGLLSATENTPERLLQHLCAIQQRYSYIPENAVEMLASRLLMPAVQIYGVIDFYTFLHREARGDFDILFSDNITDRMLGNQSLIGNLCEKLHIEPGIPRADGRVTVDVTSCTGICDQGPALLVNGIAVSGLDEERISKVAELIEENTPLHDWPASFFTVDDNIQRSDILLDDKIINGSAIQSLLKNDSDTLLTMLEQSGLRGRGGAGFKTALKWRFCRDTQATDHYVVCNADEGEPGTFKDRILLNSFADNVFEGMTLCAGIIGAKKGYVYLRGEYLYLLDRLEQALQKRRDANLLGKNICGQQGFDFDIVIHLGAGAYICGEESALIESLEGKRGIPRKRPPFPVTNGFLNQPTVVNNVETFVAAAKIAVFGADWYSSIGTSESTGTKLLSISGDCARPGIYEYPFGVSVRQILEDCGARDTQAVQVAGAAGATIPPQEFDRSIAFEDLSTGGSFMVFNQQRDLLDMVQNFSHFFCHESCGFCTPCRVGGPLMKNLLDKVIVGHATRNDLKEMENIGQIMQQNSHCGLGATAPNPVLDTLDKFPEIYTKRLANRGFEPAFDLDAALEESRQITGRDDTEAHIGYEPLLDTAKQDES
ncbi:NAD(P)H-dependent oxidoreductase subunit E [bacterium]|nr:NAD(P)H-dependent oxidoreductase subunit E [bacterium]